MTHDGPVRQAAWQCLCLLLASTAVYCSSTAAYLFGRGFLSLTSSFEVFLAWGPFHMHALAVGELACFVGPLLICPCFLWHQLGQVWAKLTVCSKPVLLCKFCVPDVTITVTCFVRLCGLICLVRWDSCTSVDTALGCGVVPRHNCQPSLYASGSLLLRLCWALAS